MDKQDIQNIRNWRRRGYYSEMRLVKLLQKHGFNALRIPLSNPSLNPLPDVLARREEDTYAFEVKNGNFQVVIHRHQILKLFEFLEQYITSDRSLKHVILACHLGRIWKFKELKWKLYDTDSIPDKVTVSRKNRSNWKYKP